MTRASLPAPKLTSKTEEKKAVEKIGYKSCCRKNAGKLFGFICIILLVIQILKVHHHVSKRYGITAELSFGAPESNREDEAILTPPGIIPLSSSPIPLSSLSNETRSKEGALKFRSEGLSFIQRESREQDRRPLQKYAKPVRSFEKKQSDKKTGPNRKTKKSSNIFTEHSKAASFYVNQNTTPDQKKAKKSSKMIGARIPEYLRDVTREESYRNYTGADLPIISHLREKYPHMGFIPVPFDRWKSLDNTTCVSNEGSDINSEGDVSQDRSYFHQAPHALILGAQKSGSSALAKYLYSHSQVVPTRKELHFLSERMDRYIYHRDRYELNNYSSRNDLIVGGWASETGGIDQGTSRAHYQRFIGESAAFKDHSRAIIVNNPTPSFKMRNQTSSVSINAIRYPRPWYVIDATPVYLPKSDRVPQRALCLCPWAKLIVLLRDPIQRAYSQYNMEVTFQQNREKRMRLKQGHKISQPQSNSFEEWIERDYDTLLELGLLPSSKATDEERQAFVEAATTPGTPEAIAQHRSWSIYTKLGTSMPIGRGLYAIQLFHWIQAYAEYDVARSSMRSSNTLQLLVVSSDDLKTKTEPTYRRILDFLGLPHEIPSEFKYHHERSYDRIEPMSNTSRKFLASIFKPYNRRLAELLNDSKKGLTAGSKTTASIGIEWQVSW